MYIDSRVHARVLIKTTGAHLEATLHADGPLDVRGLAS